MKSSATTGYEDDALSVATFSETLAMTSGWERGPPEQVTQRVADFVKVPGNLGFLATCRAAVTVEHGAIATAGAVL